MSNVVVEFQRLAALWKEETRFESSPVRMTEHPAYREIVKLGRAGVPLILRELQTEPDWWFAALREITGVDPAEHLAGSGDLQAIADAWLQWGGGGDASARLADGGAQ